MNFTVSNGYSGILKGLGRNKPIRNLSQSRITKAVRDHLRIIYGIMNVKVSCHAIYHQGHWSGNCKINNTSYTYNI